MGRYDFRASRVRQVAAMFLDNKTSAALVSKNLSPLPTPPCWYQAVSDYPPTESVVRTLPVQHHRRVPPLDAPAARPAHRRRTKKPSKMYAPQPIVYEEDGLRSDFFADHPWELARPRQLLEDDGKDHQRWDWSKPHQPGRPVNGESVIQRQLHLMRHAGHSKAAAYDQARKEHYAARHAAETETRIAREEARAVGAAFGLSALDVGMQLENRTFEQWRVWAEERVTQMEQTRAAAYTGDGTGAEAGGDGEEVDADGDDGGLEALIGSLGGEDGGDSSSSSSSPEGSG